LEILGRRDFQIQLRGIRIELAGIERTVQELGLAAQCAVVARKGEDGELRLVAFVVNPRHASAGGFRRALAKELPDYMVPHHMAVLEAMPLTVNGKLDRNRLGEMRWKPAPDTAPGEREPPANEREEKVAGVFAHVLGRGSGDVGAEDSFFDLGGDSLLGVVALEEIERALGVRIPPHVLFERGTVRALAAHAPGPAMSRPILLNAQVPGPPLFMLSGVHIYRELARCLDGRCSAYGVFAPREVEAFDPAGGAHSVEDLARDYVQLIRGEQPRGPYRLLGYSFAGVVAYEAAHQLRAAGEDVRFLALVDALLPEWTQRWRFRRAQLARLWSAPPGDVLSFLWRRIRHGRPSPREGLVRYTDDQKLGPLERQRDDTNRDAAVRYLPRLRPFEGPVTLIVSGERLRHDPLKSPSCGWSAYIPSLDIHRIEADHFRMLSDQPHVSEMAAILEAGMRRVDGDAKLRRL
ncbi:MAG TPA: thioesterase domain-containing protein, partial [Myxococcales bacterium]|nr:thioesterase domain-containing protein [Myxococcales bacterium]